MAIKQQEKNFLIAVIVFGLFIGLAIVVLPLLSGGDKNKSSTPPPNSESVRVEIDTTPAKAPAAAKEQQPESPEQEKDPEPEPQPEEPDEPPPTEGTLVLSKAAKVPNGYFEDSSGVAPLPRVVERYLEAVNNGSRFMGRLESIALRDKKALEEQRQEAEKSLPLTLARGDLTKVISYNMKINTPFLSATFDADAIDDFKGDILVEWVDVESDQRIELFFTPISRDGATGQFRLNMPSEAVPPASQVFVYSATDDMPLIASGVYTPE